MLVYYNIIHCNKVYAIPETTQIVVKLLELNYRNKLGFIRLLPIVYDSTTTLQKT